MSNLGNLWYQLGIRDMTDADLQRIRQKLEHLGIKLDVNTLRQQIEAGIGATPFNAKITFGNARADLESIFLNNRYGVTVEVIASRLYNSIKASLDNFSTETTVLPKKKELRKAVSDALLSSGFEVNIDKVKGLSTSVNNVLGTSHTLNVAVDPAKLASAISRALGGITDKHIGVEAKDSILLGSIRRALRTEKFPIRVIVQKAEAQEAVRQALQAAGLQGSGFTASDKRASDARARMLEAQARAAASYALAQRRVGSAHTTARRAADSHLHSSISLGSAMRGNIRIAGELGPMLASAYSVVALKNFMQKVVEIGGELEQQKIAMKSILGDEGMANTIASQINRLAVKSPFGVMELNQYAKQLTAFQIPYNELFDTMKRMADISAAVGVDMGRIILAFGQVRAAKFLKGTELRQFTEANIPMIDMLAQRFTKLKGEIVSAGDIMDMISKKQVTFEDVKAVLWELTDEGGRFNNMQEVLSESVKAKWKNLADAIDLMFADIAESTGGPLKSLAEILTTLTRNWDILAAGVAGVGIAFGTAKLYAMIFSRALDASGKAAIKAAADSALLERRYLNLARSYRNLTAEERQTLSTSLPFWQNRSSQIRSLTAQQFEQLVATQQITKAEWERMIACGQLTTAQKNLLETGGIMTRAEIDNIKVLGRWRRAFIGVGNALRGVGRAMMALMANPMVWITAAISAISMLWEKNSAESEAVEQKMKDVETATAEASKNLRNIVKDLPVSGAGMGEAELTQGIEKLTQAVKDYSSTAEQDLLGSLINQRGEVASLVEQYENLLQVVRGLADDAEADVSVGFGKALEKAIGDAKGLLEDGLTTDMEDLLGSLAESETYLAEMMANSRKEVARALAVAMENDPAFKTVAANLKTQEQQFSELVRNASNYADAVRAIYSSDSRSTFNTIRTGYINKFASDYQELKTEFYQTLQKQVGRAAVMGITPDNLSVGNKRALIAWFDRTAEGLPEHIKQYLKTLFTMVWKFDIDDGKAERAVIEQFGKLFESASPELAKRLRAGMKMEDLQLMDDDSASNMVVAAANNVMRNMPYFKDTIQGYLNDNTFIARIIAEWSGSNQYSGLKKMLWSSDDDNLRFYAVTYEQIFDRMVSGANSTRDVQANYIKEGKDIKERIKAAKSNNAAAEELHNLEIEFNNLAESYRRAHFGSLENDVKKGARDGGSQKDTVAEDFRARFKDLKDAWAMYKEWQKSVGDDAAFDTVANSGLFQYIDIDEMPRSVEAYDKAIEALKAQLESAGVKGHPQRESLLNEMIKTLFDVRKSVVDEQLRVSLDTIGKEAERQIANWNLFDKIRKATGNQKLAMSMAFGLDVKGETDYPTMIKRQLDKTVAEAEKALSKTSDAYRIQGYDYGSLKSLYDARGTDSGGEAWLNVPAEIRDAWEKANADIVKYFDQQREALSGVLEQYQSLQDKIAKIDAEREANLRLVNESDGMSEPTKEKYRQRINVEADYKKFTQSAEYLQFFAGIYALTEQEATRIGDLIESNLDKRLQAGAISAEDYYKEVERVRQQLDKIRNVKSDSMTFLTKGLTGLNDKAAEVNGAKRLELMQEIEKLENDIATAKEEGDADALLVSEMLLENKKKELSVQDKIRDKLVKDKEGMQDVLDIANLAANIAGGISDAFNTLRDLADSLGFDTDSDAWNTVGTAVDTLTTVTGGVQKIVQSLLSGDIGGIISGTFDTILTPFTIWSRLHDKKLEKMIERSREAAQIMQNQYDILEARMKSFLGNAALMRVDGYYGQGGAYGNQRELMQGQLDELEKQRQAEMDKKKSDDSVVADYDKQIAEMEIAVRDFAMEAANAVYSIDLNGWAERLGDSLVDAFAKGEDAAKAFDDTVGDILRDVTSKMISQDILAPMFGDLRNFLFGENGVGGAYGADFMLDPSELGAMKEYLDKIKNEGVPAAQKLFDAINSSTGGLLDETDKAKNGLSAGIQSVTEDTADLLASYVNAIRASVAMNEGRWERLLNDSLPQMSVIAQSQLDYQRQIAENTMRNAVAAEAIEASTARLVEINDSMGRSWRRIAERNWGYS